MNLTGTEIMEILNQREAVIKYSILHLELKIENLKKNNRQIPAYIPKRMSVLTHRKKQLESLINYITTEDAKRNGEIITP